MNRHPPSVYDFRTADYPQGLTIKVEGVTVHHSPGYWEGTEAIDGTGWAEAAFDKPMPESKLFRPLTRRAQWREDEARKDGRFSGPIPYIYGNDECPAC